MKTCPLIFTAVVLGVSVLSLTGSCQQIDCSAANACENEVIAVDALSNFSIDCRGYRSCHNATVVVQNDSALFQDIECETNTENCRGMQLEVHNSDLEASGFKLDCADDGSIDSCDDMRIVLMYSTLRFACSHSDCDRMRVELYDSDLVISSLSDSGAFTDGSLQVYLSGNSRLIDNKGLGEYIDIVARISQPMDCSNNYGCQNDEITFIAGSALSLNCEGYHSCHNATVLVESGCTLIDDIDCGKHSANCKFMSLRVVDSDLAADGFRLDCSDINSVNSCDDVHLALVRSTLRVTCSAEDCGRMRVDLSDSQFFIGSGTSNEAFASGNLQVYLYGASEVVDEKGVGQFIDIFARISVPMDCSSNYACENDEITFIAGSSFSLDCRADYACYNAKVVAESDTTLIDDIDCDQFIESCMSMQLEVFDSDLAASGWKLDCYDSGSEDSCDDMQLTLINSTLRIVCSAENCDRISVYLKDSQLIIDSMTSSDAFIGGNIQVYLCGSSVLTDEKGLSEFIDIHYCDTTTTFGPWIDSSTGKPTLTTEKATTGKPTTEKPTTEKPTTEKPTTEEPTTTSDTLLETSTDTPVTDKPKSQKQSTDEWLVILCAVAAGWCVLCGLLFLAHYFWLAFLKKRSLSQASSVENMTSVKIEMVAIPVEKALVTDSRFVRVLSKSGDENMQSTTGGEGMRQDDDDSYSDSEELYEPGPGRVAEAETRDSLPPQPFVAAALCTPKRVAFCMPPEDVSGEESDSKENALCAEIGEEYLDYEHSAIAGYISGERKAAGGRDTVDALDSTLPILSLGGEKSMSVILSEVKRISSMISQVEGGSRLADFVLRLKLNAKGEEQTLTVQLLETALALNNATMQQEFERLSALELSSESLAERLADKAGNMLRALLQIRALSACAVED